MKFKQIETVNAEWDSLAQLRFDQITSGIDITFSHVLVPTVCELISAEPKGLTLDAGCGVGALTPFLAEQAVKVIGIDPSPRSIELAKHHFGQYAEFWVGKLEDAVGDMQNQADLVVANMVLMDVFDLNSFLASVRYALRPKGKFVFSITHPWFWPEYSGYVNEKWFKYDEELVIEAPFRITNDSSSSLVSTHIHRPLQIYSEAMRRNSLQLEELLEPMPNSEIERLYAAPWRYPRYIVGKCKKND